MFDRGRQRAFLIICAGGGGGVGVVVEEEGRDEGIASSAAASLHEAGAILWKAIEVRDGWVVLI